LQLKLFHPSFIIHTSAFQLSSVSIRVLRGRFFHLGYGLETHPPATQAVTD
jgi:hypothetical protein